MNERQKSVVSSQWSVVRKKGILLSFILPALFHYSSSSAYAFINAGEFRLHTKGSANCAANECHPGFMKGAAAFGHKPSGDGECGACHAAEAYPNRYGLAPDQGIVCTGCHKSTEKEIQTEQFVHGPLKNGDCTACHDPHGSAYQFILKEPYSKLCYRCHSRKALHSGSFIHKPVEDGNCGLCHDPHASDNKARLTDTETGLCLSCHEDMVSGMSSEHVHAPLLKTGCIVCHDPHSGDSKVRLKNAESQICVNCHEEKKNEIAHYTQKHGPAAQGQCVRCHSPHFSKKKYLLKDDIDKLCYACHKDKAIWQKLRFMHGPLVQGNCSACHNPHGSDNAYILRMSFPYSFYSAYEKGKYSLCFNCHKEALVTSEHTVTATNFRNGGKNLHWFHVKQEKGRTCRACHDVHASDQEYHIRDEFPFGSASIPLEYRKTFTGGSCLPGCHKERKYDRIKAVLN